MPIQRRIHSYCVGAGKTGTVSFSSMFADNYRSAHEPMTERMVEVQVERWFGAISREYIRQWLIIRDRTLALEMESSNFVAHFVADLVDVFPKSRFVLTVRDCCSWLESFLGLQLELNSRPRSPVFDEFRRMRFNPLNLSHAPEERALAVAGLFPIRGYLSYWRDHIKMVVDHVPRERLLVVRTDQITKSIPQVARFLGVDEGSIVASKSGSNRSATRSKMLSELDPEFLRDAIRDCCADSMTEYFPELRLKDYGTPRAGQ